MIPWLLASLAILDASFAGFRAAAGRDARIFKRPYYWRAVLLGAGAGVVLVIVLAAATGAVLLASDDPGALWDELLVIGGRMLHVLLGYSILVIGALSLYATARMDLRILATVSILGPFTLCRPLIVVVATAWGVVPSRDATAVALALISSAAVLLLGWVLDVGYGRARHA